MNTHVNLIRPNEVRGSGVFSLKLYLLVTGLILLLVGFLMTLALLQGQRERASQWDALERQWSEAQRARQAVEATQAELVEIEMWHGAVKGWEVSRIAWHGFLEELRDVVPTAIQLRSLRMRATPQSLAGGGMAQVYHVLIEGYCRAPDAEQQVDHLRRGLAEHPAFASWMESVRVTSFREDTAEGARPDDRFFRLELSFYPRDFNETAGR